MATPVLQVPPARVPYALPTFLQPALLFLLLFAKLLVRFSVPWILFATNRHKAIKGDRQQQDPLCQGRLPRVMSG